MPLPFEASPDRKRGDEFVDYLYDRCLGLTDTPTQARALSRRLWAFLQEWGRLNDELHREPTVEEYAKRWRMPLRSANHAFAEFFGAFPTEQDPGRISKELWKGIGLQGNGGIMALGSVRVVAR
jgi:hypothetical protein